MRLGGIHDQNEHNHENQIVSGKELCEFYCLGLHKRLNSSRHRVHWLASKSDSLSQRNVQSHTLPIPIQQLFKSTLSQCLH